MTQQLEMRRGDTPIWDVAVTETVDGVTSPFDLTGATLYFTAKQSLGEADPGLFQLTNGAGITVTDAAGGLATIQPARDDTSGLTADWRGFWDVQVSRDGTEQTHTVLNGTLLIVRDVTRAP